MMRFSTMGMKNLACVAFLLAACPARAATAPNPCQGKHNSEVQTIFDNTMGIDRNFYTIVAGRFRVPRMIGNRDVELQNNAQTKALADAFYRVTTLGLSYEMARPYYVEGFQRLRQNGDQAIMREDVKIYKELEIRNWDDCSYTFEVQLAVPRFPTLGIDIGRLLGSNNLDDFRSSGSKNFEVNIDVLVRRLLSNQEFREMVARALRDPKFRDRIKFKDDDTQIFFNSTASNTIEISGYPRGQFRVNSIVAAIIRNSVAPVVIELLKKYRSVTVECDGYADRLRINSGLSYLGGSDFSASSKPVLLRLETLVEEGKTKAAEEIRERFIVNNSQLSIVRAYEGLVTLGQLLGERSQHKGLKLLYRGLGEQDAPRQDHPASRKVVFRINVEEPYGH